jgi:hypothetical protein
MFNPTGLRRFSMRNKILLMAVAAALLPVAFAGCYSEPASQKLAAVIDSCALMEGYFTALEKGDHAAYLALLDVACQDDESMKTSPCLYGRLWSEKAGGRLKILGIDYPPKSVCGTRVCIEPFYGGFKKGIVLARKTRESDPYRLLGFLAWLSREQPPAAPPDGTRLNLVIRWEWPASAECNCTPLQGKTYLTIVKRGGKWYIASEKWRITSP